ncbi:MAG: hypothetical protein KDA50_13575 [Rhodobacteraceae bacterium]|nr:hypothetical protein [Paracoccaceae bacterium]
MTTMSPPAGGGARPAASHLAAAFLRWRARARDRRRIRRAREDLAGLSRHLLRDIGLEDYADPLEPEIRAQRH